MTTILTAIASFIGRILREILPAWFDEQRRPRETKIIGEAPKDDVKESIEDSINSPKD